jgi:hypothetical protein
MPDTLARYPTPVVADEPAPCLRCNGTGTVFHATCGNSRSGEIEGYDDDCPQCGGSGEDNG